MARKKGDGSFNKFPNGTVEFTISVGYDDYGKRIRKKFYGKTESECRKKYKEFVKGGEKNTCVSKEYTLYDWVWAWLETYKSNKVQSSTYKSYINIARHIKEHRIGSMKLSRVKPLHITEYFTDILDFSKSFRDQSRFVLNGAFESAIDNDFCFKNPVKRAEIAKKPQTEKAPFTEEEAKAILEFAKTDELFGLPIYIMLNTGMRGQEIRALTVDKIDFDKGTILIDRAVKRNGELGTTKNGKHRIIPISSEVSEFIKSKLHPNSIYVLGGMEFLSYDEFKDRYEAFFKRLNETRRGLQQEPINDKPPHTLRHTCSTLWQDKGMSRELVAEILGHQSVDTTKIYTHTQLSTLKRAVDEYSFA